MNEQKNPNLLFFVNKNDPILRETISEILDFKDPALYKAVEDMCYSILPEQLKKANGAYESAAGMAANQWGIRMRVFIFTPEGSERGKKLEIMINPSYTAFLRPNEDKPKLISEFEGCFSVPLTTGMVNRYEVIKATYYNLQGEKIERIMEGWEARVFQHETDHLDGKLFDGTWDNYPGPACLERIIFKDKEEMENFWSNQVRPSRENEKN